MVTSEVNMERAATVFSRVFSSDYYSSARGGVPPKIGFYNAPNTGVLEDELGMAVIYMFIGMTEAEVSTERTRERIIIQDLDPYLQRYGYVASCLSPEL